MAKPYIADSGHAVIEITPAEATKLGFGIKDIDSLLTGNNTCICGSCNNTINPNTMHYLPSINEVLCEECMEDFVNNMKHYNDEDSIRYELTHYDSIKVRLGIEESLDFKDGNLVMK